MSEKPTSFSIKNWSQDDRPREKLRDKGARSLSDAELVAILIGSGSVQESAVDLSKRILVPPSTSSTKVVSFISTILP